MAVATHHPPPPSRPTHPPTGASADGGAGADDAAGVLLPVADGQAPGSPCRSVRRRVVDAAASRTPCRIGRCPGGQQRGRIAAARRRGCWLRLIVAVKSLAFLLFLKLRDGFGHLALAAAALPSTADARRARHPNDVVLPDPVGRQGAVEVKDVALPRYGIVAGESLGRHQGEDLAHLLVLVNVEELRSSSSPSPHSRTRAVEAKAAGTGKGRRCKPRCRPWAHVRAKTAAAGCR